MKILLETHYFPSLVYFSCLLHANEVELEAHEKFQKQTFRNRTLISDGPRNHALSIPVVHKSKSKLITEVEIDFTENWQNQHWRAIQASYGKAPYFEFYSDEVRTLIYSDEKYLFKKNEAILTKCLKWLGIQHEKINLTKEYVKSPKPGILDLRSAIHPKKKDDKISYINYNQHFGNNFVEGLSIIDLLFNEGPGSILVLREQVKMINFEPRTVIDR